MATQTTGGGSTTSFTNTPQASDDNYEFVEDWLRTSSLYDLATNTVTLDVMSDDSGGKAKTLFSIDDGNGNPLDPDFELLCKDVDSSGVSCWEKTPDGNFIRINNGKIEFRIANPEYPDDPNQALDINSLGAGECIDDEFVYSIRLGNGTLSQATVHIHITGVNDAPDAVADTATTDEDTSVLIDVLANDTDPDASDELTITDADVTSGDGSVTIEDGKLRYDPGSAYNHLAAGESAEVEITYTISDGNGGSDTATVTVTVEGVNDAPDAVADTATTDEDTSVLIDVLANDTDPDASDELTITDADVTSGDGSVTIEDGKLRYDPGSAYNHLAAGESAEVEITYTISDGNGGSDTATVTVTVEGVNDDVLDPSDIKFSLAPTVGGLTGGSLAGNATLGSFTAVDGDSTSWTFELSGDDAALFSLSPSTGGTVNLVTVAAGISTGQYTFEVTATDSGGNSYVETFTVSVGTSGDDGAVTFTVTAGSDLSFGLNNGDEINGGNGEDALVGGNGTDTLNGGLGNDQLFGGAQSDTFIFNTAIAPDANVDQILDFNAGGGQADRIHLDNAIFTQLAAGNLAAGNFAANAGGNATDANDFILYDTSTGNLYYDADGNGGGDKVLIAQLTVVTGAVDAADFFVI